MDQSLELRLIERGFDISRPLTLTLQDAALAIQEMVGRRHSEGVVFFDGEGSAATINPAGALIHFRRGPIFIDDVARPQETIEIYSGEQLKGSSIDPVLVSKYNPVEIVHTGDNSLDLALGKPLDVFVAIAINLQPQTSAGYFPALPVGAPRDRLVWESIGRNLELDLNFVDDEGGAKYAASAQDSRYSGNTVSLTLRTQNNKYVVDASYKPHPSHVTDLTQQLAGLDAQVVRDDPSLSSQARGFINHVQVHFDVGKAHHVYTYLKRVLGK